MALGYTLYEYKSHLIFKEKPVEHNGKSASLIVIYQNYCKITSDRKI